MARRTKMMDYDSGVKVFVNLITFIFILIFLFIKLFVSGISSIVNFIKSLSNK